MIKKVISISKDGAFDDEVNLSWFDMRKPNLSACTNLGINFIIKAKFTHLHTNNILICDDGYKIKIKKEKDEIYEISFKKCLDFAKVAYEIGNRHQSISIEDMKITILFDISTEDIIKSISNNENIKVNKSLQYFEANKNAHHKH